MLEMFDFKGFMDLRFIWNRDGGIPSLSYLVEVGRKIGGFYDGY